MNTDRHADSQSLPYANLGIRLLAMVLDGLLLIFLWSLLRFFQALLGAPAETEATPLFLDYGTMALVFLGAMAITALCWHWFAGTPGKLLVDIRVIGVNTGQPPGLAQAVLRFAAYPISLLPASLGFLWTFWDRRRQGFHDKLSRTVVIHEDESRKSLPQLLEELR